MIDKLAGLPTQIRQLEKRLKEMDASKVKPALVKEITDTIKNLKDMLKEKQEKREQRAKAKAEKPQEVEAAPVAPAPAIGATAPNAVPATMPGQPEATPTTPDDQKISCPLCGGMTFNDQGAYQQHMEFTHASDVMPTTPGQKLDKTVAAVDPVVNKVETDPKIAPGIIVPDSVKKHDEVVDRVENDPKIAPHIVSDQEPQFKLDDAVSPVRGSESKGKVMRWDGKPNDLVYVMWESGPLKDRDNFGGYYPHDLKADKPAEAPVEAAITTDEPVCEKCSDMQAKHGDLKTNYEALLKDLQEERDIHYTQGNNAWVARLDQKIDDLKNAIAEKFGTEKTADEGLDEPEGNTQVSNAIDGLEDLHDIIENRLGWAVAGQFKGLMEGEALEEQNKNALRYIAEFLEKRKNEGAADVAKEIRTYLSKMPAPGTTDLPAVKHDPKDLLGLPNKVQDTAPNQEVSGKVNFPNGLPKEALGGPELIREVKKAKTGFGYEATVYDLTNGRFQQNVPLKINETNVRRRQPENGTFELKYSGMPEWRPVLQPEFDQWLAQWKEINQKNNQKEGAAENAQELTIMDHTPPRANSGPDAGGKDSHDEFQDEWAMPKGIDLESKLSRKQQNELDNLVQQSVYGYQIPIMEMSKISQAGEAAYMTGGADAVMPAVKAYLDGMVAAGKAQKTAALEPMKLNVFNRELLATPSKEGYDVSHEGKKLFNIKGKNNQPLNQKQLEFCAQIEFTRGMKEAKLVEKIANLERGSRVFIMAHDKTSRRVKFASLEHGYRGWASASKFAYLVKEGQMMQHKDHIDNTFGTNGKEALVDCPNGSGNMVWLPMGELLPINPPPATPESLNDLESGSSHTKCIHCGGPLGINDDTVCLKCWDKGNSAPLDKKKTAAMNYNPDDKPLSFFIRPETKERADMFGLIDVEDGDLTPEGLAAKREEMIEGHDIEGGKGPEYKLTPDMICQQCQTDLAIPGKGMCKDCYKEYLNCNPEFRKASKKASRPTWRPCKSCGKDFMTSNYRDYCSDECYAKAGSPKEAPVEPWPVYHEERPRGRYAAMNVTTDAKNPISWNGQNYFGILVDMEGNIISGYTYEQGEEAGWDLYFTIEEEHAWDNGELAYVFTDGKSPELIYQWGITWTHDGPTGLPEAEQPAKEAELTPKILSQVKVSMGKTAAKECPDCHGTYEGAEGEKCPTCGRFAVQKTASDPLVQEFKAKHPSYNGWEFDYEYPGYYVFYSPDGSKNVYFTPDFNTEGVVDIQVTTSEGENTTVEDVPYKAPLTADALFAIVKPYLDQQGSEKTALAPALPKAILPQRGDVNPTQLPTVDPVNGPSDADVQQKAYEMFKAHWDALSSEQMDEVYKALGVTSSLKKADYEDEEEAGTGIEPGDLVDFGAYGQLYVVSLSGRSSRVTDLKEERFNPNAPGWYFNVSGNEPILEKGSDALDPDQDDDDLDYKGARNCTQCGAEFTPNHPNEQYCSKNCWKDSGARVVSSLNKVARVVHREDGWHVLSEKGKNLGGPYKSKGEAVKRLRQVEYFKHHGAIRPFNRQVIADAMTDLTTHVTDMKSRMTDVQEKLQNAPAVKTADVVTDETITTNDPNAIIDPTNPLSPEQAAALPTIKNVQPTDDDNLEVPVVAPTSPPAPGQKWVFDTQFNKYVSMPDPAAANRTM